MTVARKLHHPIAVFVVAVFVVIGIGVGVGALGWNEPLPGTGVSHEYGLSGYRFRARFPGPVKCTVIQEGALAVHVCESNESRVGFTVVVSGGPPPSDILSALNARGKTVRFGPIYGYRTPIRCDAVGLAHHEQSCGAEMLLTDGKTSWQVGVFGTVPSGTTQPMTQFLDSFRPIG